MMMSRYRITSRLANRSAQRQKTGSLVPQLQLQLYYSPVVPHCESAPTLKLPCVASALCGRPGLVLTATEIRTVSQFHIGDKSGIAKLNRKLNTASILTLPSYIFGSICSGFWMQLECSFKSVK